MNAIPQGREFSLGDNETNTRARARAPQAIAFIEATRRQCRWFLDGESGMQGLVCGCTTMSGKPYCADHGARSRRPSRDG